MHKHLTLVFATLALSAAAFAQSDYYLSDRLRGQPEHW